MRCPHCGRGDETRVEPEFDPAKVEALLEAVEGLADTFYWKRFRALAAAVRSSSRPKGRVVEGWAVVHQSGNVQTVRFHEPDDYNRRELLEMYNERIIPCTIILDAPEEGSK